MPVSCRMVNRLMLLIFSLVAVLMAPGVGRAEERELIKIVEVIGTGAIHGKDVEKAREDSIANGLVAAVELAAADLLPIESLVRNFKTLNQAVYEQTARFVQNYKVLTELRLTKQYRVMIQATVSLAKLKKELVRSGVIQVRKTLPGILLITAVPKLLDAAPQYRGEGSSPFSKADVERAMATKMRANGFRIIRPTDPGLRLEAESLGRRSPIDIQRALDLASRMKADLLVLAHATVQRSQNRLGTNLRSYRCTVTARAFRIDSGIEMATTAQTAVRMNTDEAAGGRDALSAAGSLSGDALSVEMAAAWQQSAVKSAKVAIVVARTANLSNFVRFRKAINNMSGVTGVQIREMRPDEATIMVEFQGNSQELAQSLMLQTFDSFAINIYEISPERLRIELIPG